MHTASQLQNPRGYDLDPSLGVEHHAMSYSHEQYKIETGHQSTPTEQYGPGYMEGETPILEVRSDEQDEVESIAEPEMARKASKSSAANELEMRQLFQSNKHRSLPEVATELHGNERGPQSERQRQVFAMLWLVFGQQ